MKILSNRKYRKLVGEILEYQEMLQRNRIFYKKHQKNTEKVHEIQLTVIAHIFDDMLERAQEETTNKVVQEMELNLKKQKWKEVKILKWQIQI